MSTLPCLNVAPADANSHVLILHAATWSEQNKTDVKHVDIISNFPQYYRESFPSRIPP